MPLEGVYRLVDKSYPVGKEKHTFYPVAAHEEVAERDYGSGLACACCHYYEGFPVGVLFKGFPYAPDGSGLIVAFYYC